ncbi:MAG TPA: polymer-forming cytoskeletal protein [Hyphomicrobiaceae bacterium]|nr:polymer-forming cytoskeletal protein [Hyphomicrobiaceae bacterium]
MRRAERPGAPPRQPVQDPSVAAGNESVIGSDLSIEGQSITIRCKGSLKVLGNIQADLHSKQLEVGREAIISGSIAADMVSVHGRVNGAILGTNVVLHASAEVDGDIHSHLLTIEQGASFDGRSRRVVDPAEIAPQLERSSPMPPAQHEGVQPPRLDRMPPGGPPPYLHS